MVKLLIGGSPCTHWSIAQSKNRETQAEGAGWELFRNYLIARDKFKPDFFLYENNKSASQAIKNQIAKELGVGVDPLARFTYINSALVSAQNRQRFYVTNFGEIQQPADRGVLLQDILENGGEAIGTTVDGKSYAIKAQYYKNGNPNFLTNGGFQATGAAEPVKPDRVGTWPYYQQQAGRIYGAEGKSVTLKATDGGGGAATGFYAVPVDSQAKGYKDAHVRVGCLPNSRGELNDNQSKRIYAIDAKSVTLQSAASAGGCSDTSSSRTGLYAIPVTFDGDIPLTAISCADGKTYPVYCVKDGQITIKGKQYHIKLTDGYYIIRKLTVVECCRLQTLPDDYCRAVSATQAYKGLGNGWTAEVIIHLLNHSLKDVSRNEEIVVLSMYDGIGTGRYCLDKMGFKNVCYYAYEIDKYAIKIAQSNYLDIIQCGDAFDVRDSNWFFAGKMAG